MIAPVLFVEELPLLVLPLLPLVSFAGASVVEAVTGPDVLRGDASIDLGGDETTTVAFRFGVVVVDDDCAVAELESEVGEMR